MNLYCYVIAVDAGTAPNYEPPLATLAICKPRIREGASVGDAILAFTGSAVSAEPHAVRWAGVIAEKLNFAEYWNDRRFGGKKSAASHNADNIYAPRGDGYGFEQIKNRAHGSESKLRDLGGRYVLVLDPHWHFRGGAPILPADYGYRMPLTARRGHRRHTLTPDAWRRLKTWLNAKKKEARSVDYNREFRGGAPPAACRPMAKRGGKC